MDALLAILVITGVIVTLVMLARLLRHHQRRGLAAPPVAGPPPELFQPVWHARPPRRPPGQHQASEDLMERGGRRIGETICFVTGMQAEQCTCASHRQRQRR